MSPENHQALSCFLIVTGALLAASGARWGFRGLATGTLYWLRFALLAAVLPITWTVAANAPTRHSIGRAVLAGSS